MNKASTRETAKRICENLKKFTTLSGREVDYVENEINKLFISSDLYHSINMMICELSAKGEIHPKNSRVGNVMDALYNIDGGVYCEEGGDNNE